ncbi:MAG TPA: hypothetical protein VGY48_14490 [Vicinamibacterales bacterium]|nr:hypothetical protein [Vicinamibacterales bacterium]
MRKKLLRNLVSCAALMTTLTIADRADAQTWVAWAQSGGFDANGAVGVGRSPDRFVAIGDAERDCQGKSFQCGSAGDCALKPGLYAAFASDGQWVGNKGFVCNEPTLQLAQQKAVALCGANCTLKWSGSAAGATVPSLDELKAWVRTTFRQVVGRTPSEDAVTGYANQLRAFAQRGQLHEVQEEFAKQIFPSLR